MKKYLRIDPFAFVEDGGGGKGETTIISTLSHWLSIKLKRVLEQL